MDVQGTGLEEKMTEESELGKFLFGLRIIKNPDGTIEYKFRSINQSVPVEIVIMQLKAFVNKLENDYFDEFNKVTK